MEDIRASLTTKTSQGQVDRELDETTSELDRLHMVIDSLENRLHPALRADERPGPGTDGEIPRELIAPLAHAIRVHRESVTRARLRIDLLLEHLEF